MYRESPKFYYGKVVSALQLTFSGPATRFVTGKSSPTTLQEELAERLSRDTVDNLPLTSNQVLICTDFDLRILARTGRYLNQYTHRVLLRFEPEVVNPLGYTKIFEAKFDAIIHVGRSSSGAKYTLPWPQPSLGLDVVQEIGERVQDEFPIINANKISLLPGELYSLRRKLAQRIPGVVLFGNGWGPGLRKRVKPLMVAALMALIVGKFRLSGMKLWFSNYHNWRGSAEDKQLTLSQFKSALVIENSREFLSEKLFDAWSAGCVPVYVGLEDLSSLGLPRNLVVEAEPNLPAVRRALATAAAIDSASFMKAVRVWLDSETCHGVWGMESFLDELAVTVRQIASEN
jgi:hypothetical protein